MRNEKKNRYNISYKKKNIILNKGSQIKTLSKILEYTESYQEKLLKEEKGNAIYSNKYKRGKIILNKDLYKTKTIFLCIKFFETLKI